MMSVCDRCGRGGPVRYIYELDEALCGSCLQGGVF